MTEASTDGANGDPELAQALAWEAAGAGAAVATVVETWGSAPRPAGSRLVCNAAGRFVGSVSGGCVEVAVIEAAQAVLAGAAPCVLSYGVSDEQAWSVGLACGGRIRVFVESLADPARRQAYVQLQAAARAGQAAVLRLPLGAAAPIMVSGAELAAGDHAVLRSDRAALQVGEGGEVLLVPANPPLRLVIVGAVHITEYLSRFAQAAGYAVTIIDPRSAFLRPELFPGAVLLDEWPQVAMPRLGLEARSAVVLLTHDPKIDDPALHAVLATPAFYVGALGSARTQARRLERLAAEGLVPEALARIHGPAGLSIRARTPAEIAISVLAQVTAVLRGADA
jgi:xanthine dehydrogenase accessory factor